MDPKKASFLSSAGRVKARAINRGKAASPPFQEEWDEGHYYKSVKEVQRLSKKSFYQTFYDNHFSYNKILLPSWKVHISIGENHRIHYICFKMRAP